MTRNEAKIGKKRQTKVKSTQILSWEETTLRNGLSCFEKEK